MSEPEHKHCRKCSTCESWSCSDQVFLDLPGYTDDAGRWYCSRLCHYGARKLKERSDY